MQLFFTNQFVKQIRRVKDKHLAQNIESTILAVKSAHDLSDISNLKKLKGSQNAYRIRVGDYRIGVFVSQDTAEFVCFMHRKDIYRYFP